MAAAWAASLPSGVTDDLAVSRDAGATFGERVRVNAKPGDAHVNGEQPPPSPFGVGERAPPESLSYGRRRTSRGNDCVSTLDRPRQDLRSHYGRSRLQGPGNRGWERTSPLIGPVKVHVVWLDHRELANLAR